MAARGGVMDVTMVRIFVRAGGPVKMENVLDHLDCIVRLAGVEHAGELNRYAVISCEREALPSR
jgi:membrane dipeptidase